MIDPAPGFGISSLLRFALFTISPGRPSWQRLSAYTDCFLRVYDLNISDNRGLKVSASTNTYDELQDCFANLPSPEPGSIRIYIEEGCMAKEVFQNHLKRIESEALGGSKFFGCAGRGGFGGLFSQWGALVEQTWWSEVSYELSIPENTPAKTLYGVIGGADAFLAGLFQFRRLVRLVEASDGHLTGRSWLLGRTAANIT
jgi:hypothetical protein